MSTVFVNIALSLDGYMAPEGMDLAHFSDPEYKNRGAKWGALMSWALNQQYLREKLKLDPGGETGPSTIWFATPLNVPVPTSWGSAYSTAASLAGLRRLRYTRPSKF